MRTMKIIFATLLLCAVFLLCTITTANTKTLTLETMPSDLSVKRGGKIILKLDTNHAIGSWQINIQNPKDNDVLIKLDEICKTKNKMVLDGGSTLIYTIKAQNEGFSTVYGSYTRPWNNNELIQDFTLKVNVK